MQQNEPCVSIVMPAYNAEKFIEIAITSVIKQTIRDWELIIVDDCSTDSTYEIMCKVARVDSRIHVYRNEQNMGVAHTRNWGFSHCRGEYIALLDSDDCWYENKLEVQLQIANATKADIIYCSYAIVNEAGKKCCDDFIVPESTDFEAMLVKSVISCSTALLSREIVRNYRFETSYYHEDYALWLQLLKDGKVAVGTERVLAEYRISSGSRASNKLLSAKRRWVIYRKYLKMSMAKSLGCLAQYAIVGVKKYRSTK